MIDNFPRLENESFEQYCHRISSDIKKDKKLTWYDVADIINKEFKLDYSETYYRRKEKFYNNSILNLNKKQLEEFTEIQKNRYRVSDSNNQINSLLKRIQREDTIKEIAREMIITLDNTKYINLDTPKKINPNIKNDKEALLLLSDWHYGLEVNNIFNTFNIDICKDRVNKLFNKVVHYLELNNINSINVANLGDMISGNIHLPIRLKSRIDVISQVIQVSEILCEFLYNLSKIVDNITYCSVLDNHGRVDPSKSDSLDLENLCRIIDFYIEERLFNSNILSICKHSCDICTLKIFDYNILFNHGHKDKLGKNTIKNLNSFCNNHYDIICSAHYHHFSCEEDCGTFMIHNGSLMGTDDYAYSLRVRDVPSQSLIIISKENPVECIYKIDLN